MSGKDYFEQFEKLLKSIKEDLSATKAEIQAVNAHNSRIEMRLIGMDEKFERNLTRWKSDLFDKIDKVLGRVTTAEEEKTILEARQDEREKLDDRLKKLEVIHPKYQHPQL